MGLGFKVSLLPATCTSRGLHQAGCGCCRSSEWQNDVSSGKRNFRGRVDLCLLPCAGIPVWISWIRYISFVFYGFGLLLHIEYDGRTVYSCVNALVSADAQMSAQVNNGV